MLSMPDRVGNRPLPPVSVVDMREELKLGNRSMFSASFTERIQVVLDRKEQMVIVFK